MDLVNTGRVKEVSNVNSLWEIFFWKHKFMLFSYRKLMSRETFRQLAVYMEAVQGNLQNLS